MKTERKLRLGLFISDKIDFKTDSNKSKEGHDNNKASIHKRT